MSVGHNAKTAAEAGLQPWMHGGSELEGGCGGGEAACARLSIRKSSIGPPRAGRPLRRGTLFRRTFPHQLSGNFGPPAEIDAPNFTTRAGQASKQATFPEHRLSRVSRYRFKNTEGEPDTQAHKDTLRLNR